MIIKNKYIPVGRFDNMAIWPFIFTKNDIIPARSMRHEKIHYEQQKECFVFSLILMLIFAPWYLLPLSYFVFYAIYLVNWAIEVIKMWLGGDKKAYKDILFEKEARSMDMEKGYISTRTPFSWLKYM